MANWYGSARSNYVRIKDMAGLEKALAPFSGIEISPGDVPSTVCFLAREGWPSEGFIEEDDTEYRVDDKELFFDPRERICPFMEDGQILIMQEVGAEKLRYLTGIANAYTSKGLHLQVSLDDIYEQAANEFGVPINEITNAVY